MLAHLLLTEIMPSLNQQSHPIKTHASRSLPNKNLSLITFKREGRKGYYKYKTEMASSKLMLLFVCFVVSSLMPSTKAQDPSKLTLDYYSKTCPHAQEIVRTEMECFVRADPRNAALLLRLHFHDCFVQVSLLSLFFCVRAVKYVFILIVYIYICVRKL
jgi:hypothetical protein